MCGIFGYIGTKKNDLSGYIVDGLKKLEYRGYDSAGVVVVDDKGKFFVAKKVGEVTNLQKAIKNKKINGSIGIGHTRWATHGGVTEKNSHPHLDCNMDIAVVHNGIIENHQQLKKELIKKGHKFISETDTEIFVHLVEERLKRSKGSLTNLEDAVRKSFNKLDGLNAVVVSSKNSQVIVGFRKGSPLVVGKGKNANFISSDTPTLIGKTDKIVFLEEKEGVIIKKDSIMLIDSTTGKLKDPKISIVKMENFKEDKGNFKHFLLKEIYEQPEVVARIANYEDKDIESAAKMIKDAWGTYFTACGTASYAGLAATYMFSLIAKRHVNFAVGSEFPYLEHFLVDRSLLIAASQSGETMDTLEAVRAAKRHNSNVLALINVPGSSLSRLADKTLLLKAGPEKSVLSTKVYTAKLSVFLLLSYALNGGIKEGKSELRKVSEKLSKFLNKDLEESIKKIAKELASHENIYLIGRGLNYPTALEGALKIKESSYIHAEGFAGGELKHGVIALIEKGTPCVVIVANDEAREATLSNASELSSRGALIIGVSPRNDEVFDRFIQVPDVGSASTIANIIPLQLLAYYLTLERGNDPDKPRNLAKSVTVK